MKMVAVHVSNLGPPHLQLNALHRPEDQGKSPAVVPPLPGH